MFRFVRICMTMEGVKPKKTAQMSIRVDDEFMSRVREFEEATGVPMATLVRAATEAALNYYAAARSITFPLECQPAARKPRGENLSPPPLEAAGKA